MFVLLLWLFHLSLMGLGLGDKADDGTTGGPCGGIMKHYQECFQNVSMMADLFTSKNIPTNAAQINTRCRVFQRGMECTRSYMDSCLTEKQKKWMENEIYGAENFFQHLCNTTLFQLEFLKHTSCFGLIDADWKRCNTNYKKVLKEEIHRPSDRMQFMHFCCARYAYEQCVYTQAMYKCEKGSAPFMMTVAKILSTESQLVNCDKFEENFCATNKVGSLAKVTPTLLDFLGSFLILFLCHNSFLSNAI